MAIEVRIPTILRTYTSGAKSVEGSGATLAELIGDIDSRHGGLRERLVDDRWIALKPRWEPYRNHPVSFVMAWQRSAVGSLGPRSMPSPP